MSQLNYSFETPKAVPGGLADISFSTINSRANAENDGVMGFGMGVMNATAGKSIKLPIAAMTASTFAGVTVALPDTEQDMNGNVVVKKGRTMSVMTCGHVWARCEDDDAPSEGEKAYLIVDGDNKGTFTATEGSNVDVGAKFGNAVDEGIAEVIL